MRNAGEAEPSADIRSELASEERGLVKRLVEFPAVVTEATEKMLYYAYSVGGVQYEASQDLGGLSHLLPADPERLIGPASLKYSTRNPGNSILICEEWSGLRAPSRAA